MSTASKMRKILLADLVAAPRRAADHLVVEDAAVDPAHEDEVGDRRHVDAGGQQIDRHDIFRARVVLERLDPVERPVDRAGDLLDQIVRLRAVFLGQRRAQLLDQDVGMVVARGEQQRLAALGRAGIRARWRRRRRG